MSNVCTIDVGSTLIKAALRDSNGELIVRNEVEYPGFSQKLELFKYEELWQTTRVLIGTIAKDEGFKRLVISCQMAGFSAIDSEGNPAGPLVSGVDERVPLRGRPDLTRSGIPMGGPSTYAIFNWLKQSNEKLKSSEVRIGGIKEYLIYRMTGKWCIDPASASSTGFYDVREKDWSDLSIEASGISRDQLPEICPMDSIVGMAQEDLQDLSKSSDQIEVLCGLGDGPAANISVGAIGSGRVCLSKGTTVVARILDQGIRPGLIDYPHFIQHVMDDWYCFGLRFTYDRTSHQYLSAGEVARVMSENQLFDYLEMFFKDLAITEVRPVGGRILDLPISWDIKELGPDYQDGTKGLSLIAEGRSLPEIRDLIDFESKLEDLE